LALSGKKISRTAIERLARYRADAGPYGSKEITMMRGSGREKHFSHHGPARALAIGRSIRGSDDLASPCRKRLTELQGGRTQ
jgi:hypothetical protein